MHSPITNGFDSPYDHERNDDLSSNRHNKAATKIRSTGSSQTNGDVPKQDGQSNGTTSTDAKIGCSVSIKSLFDSTNIVAKRVVCSMDPNIEVGRQMLGPNWCEIQVVVVLEKEKSLIRSYDLLQKFGDKLEGMIVWPCHLLKVEEDFY